MAVDIDSSTQYADMGYASIGNGRRPLFSAVRWGAVLAGVVVGVSIQLVLTLLGIATGLSATDVVQGDTVGMGPLVWAGLSMLIAAFVGGYVAARMTGLKRKIDGVLHGIVTWAVTTLLFATLATSASGALVSSIFSTVSPSASPSAATATTPGIAGMLKSQIGGNVTVRALQTLENYIEAGQRDQAVRYMTNFMAVEQERAETIVDQALILSGLPDEAAPEGRKTADRVLGIASAAAWAVFGTVALSLVMGTVGGVLGSIGARRTTWTDANSSSAINPA